MKRVLEHGRYALYEVLGSGAAASVHLGVCRGRDPIPVAVKRLHDGRAREPAAVARLFDEVRLSRRVVHPNVVRVIDFVSDGEVVLAVMDYVHGEPLSRLLGDVRKSGGKVAVSIAAAIVRDVLRGLQAAHDATDVDGSPLAIVHRDATPDNVLVGVDGLARISDFGVAKADGRMQETLDGGVRGKIAYLAPEQVGGDVSAQTDVYTVGLMLWELLAGERPMQGGTEAELLVQVMNAHVPGIRTFVPDISATLEIVLARATAKEQERRFPTAAAFADALERAVGTVASAADVASWVREVAGERLANREALLNAMMATERTSAALPLGAGVDVAVANPTMGGLALPVRSRSSDGMMRRSSDAHDLGTQSSSSADIDIDAIALERSRAPRRAFLLMGTAAVVVALVFWGASSLPRTPTNGEAAAAQNGELDAGAIGSLGPGAAPTVPTFNPTPPSPVLPTSDAGPSANPGFGVPDHGGRPLPGAPGPLHGHHGGHTGNGSQSSGTNGSNAASNACDPPWAVDSSGIRRYKPECMQ